MQEWITRPATQDDLPGILRVDQRSWSSDVSPGRPYDDDHGPFDRRDPADVLVVEHEDAVVGWLNLGHPTPLPASAHVWEVQGLAVDPDLAGRGIGRALIDGAVEVARARGGRKVSLRVLGGNAGARRLYEAAGFRVEGVLRGEFLIDDRLVDDVIMALHLPPPQGVCTPRPR